MSLETVNNGGPHANSVCEKGGSHSENNHNYSGSGSTSRRMSAVRKTLEGLLGLDRGTSTQQPSQSNHKLAQIYKSIENVRFRTSRGQPVDNDIECVRGRNEERRVLSWGNWRRLITSRSVLTNHNHRFPSDNQGQQKSPQFCNSFVAKRALPSVPSPVPSNQQAEDVSHQGNAESPEPQDEDAAGGVHGIAAFIEDRPAFDVDEGAFSAEPLKGGRIDFAASIEKVKSCQNTNMEVKSINDVPNEVIQKNIMAYLSNHDVRSIGMTKSKRLKVIADYELEKRPPRVLISGGFTTGGKETSKSGIFSSRLNAKDSLQATYEPGQDYFKSMWGGFGVNCNGRIICGAGYDRSGIQLKKVFEFRNKNFVEINPLTTGRSLCSSLHISSALENHRGFLLVAGSYFGEGGNTMEYLMINNDFKSNKWRVCDDNLPCDVYGHQMNFFQNRLILTGGSGNSNKVWQGIISFNQQLRVNWSPLPSMMEIRSGHVAVVIEEKLFCIGGYGKKSSEYFSFDTNRWLKGPDFPFALYGAKAILTNQQNQCFLVGGERDGEYSASISLFDPIKGIENIEGSLEIPRSMHSAVLL